MLKTTLIKFTEWLPVLVNKIKKDEINSDKSKIIKKSRKNKIVKILIKSKS